MSLLRYGIAIDRLVDVTDIDRPHTQRRQNLGRNETEVRDFNDEVWGRVYVLFDKAKEGFRGSRGSFR